MKPSLFFMSYSLRRNKVNLVEFRNDVVAPPALLTRLLAGTALVCLFHRLQAYIFGRECHGAVLQHIARDAHVANPFCLFECWIAIPQIEKTLQVSYVLTDVDYFKIGIALHLLLYVLAVRAGFHNVHFYHLDLPN